MSKDAGLEVELTLRRARTAARAGKLDEAARLLDGLAADADSVAVLDLRARVHAQRGELAEADRCWAKAQTLAPDDTAAAHGRRTIEKITAGRRPARPVVNVGRVTIAASVVACTVLVGGTTWLVSGGGTTEPVASATRLQEEVERSQALRDRLAALDAERAAAADRSERELDVIAEQLAMPGVVVQRRANDVQVIFETGLYPRNSSISKRGATLLAEIGRRLARMEVQTTIVGHAVAVPGGRTSGGAAIALDRAQVAAQHLAAAGNLPLTSFALISADQTEAPFPDAPRNRTVTLTITPANP
jgi:hypothetical protein